MSPQATMWIVIIVLGIGTYLIRLSFIVLFGRVEPPMKLQRALRFVPPAVLSALLLPDVLYRSGTFSLSVGNARLIAASVAALVAWRTKNTLLTIVIGMIVLWVLQVFIPQA
jgi:branched-subunit amino acid transport protein